MAKSSIDINVALKESDLEDFYTHLAKRSLGMKMVVILSMIVFVAQSIRIIANPSTLESGVAWIALVIFIFVMMLCSSKYNARKIFKNNRKLQADYKYSINERSLTISSENKSTTLQWTQIQKLTESNNSLFLWLNKKQAQIIPKRCLTADEVEALRILSKISTKKK